MIEVLSNLLIAHMLADFPFQPSSWVESKKRTKGMTWYMLLHVGVVFALSFIALGRQCLHLWWAACVIAGTHLVIDIAKVRLTKSGPRSFLADQVAHIGVLLAIVYLGDIKPFWTQWWFLENNPFGVRASLIAVYLACIWPANYFVRNVLLYCHVQDAIAKSSSENSAIKQEESKEKINRSGALIGGLERAIVLTFILMGNYQAAGWTIAAKSLMRVADRDAPRSEYVLAGTLMSLAFALICAILYFVCVMDAKILVVPNLRV